MSPKDRNNLIAVAAAGGAIEKDTQPLVGRALRGVGVPTSEIDLHHLGTECCVDHR